MGSDSSGSSIAHEEKSHSSESSVDDEQQNLSSEFSADDEEKKVSSESSIQDAKKELSSESSADEEKKHSSTSKPSAERQPKRSADYEDESVSPAPPLKKSRAGPESELPVVQDTEEAHSERASSSSIWKKEYAVRKKTNVFESCDSWNRIGKLTKGQTVFSAAASVSIVDGYEMLSIEPKGAVEFAALKAVRSPDHEEVQLPISKERIAPAPKTKKQAAKKVATKKSGEQAAKAVATPIRTSRGVLKCEFVAKTELRRFDSCHSLQQVGIVQRGETVVAAAAQVVDVNGLRMLEIEGGGAVEYDGLQIEKRVKQKRGPKKGSKNKKTEAKYRSWAAAEDYDGAALKNIVFSEDETNSINKALNDLFIEKQLAEDGDEEDKQLTFDEWKQKLANEAQPRHTWNKLATMCGDALQRRQVNAIRNRILKFVQKGHYWTNEELNAFYELVEEHGPKWKKISSILNIPTIVCAKKFEAAVYRRITGNGTRLPKTWTSQEETLLIRSVVEHTRELAPTSDIPWTKVQQGVPTRSVNQCMCHWYNQTVKKLLNWEADYGVAIDPAVFRRQILRSLRRTKFTMADEDSVEWSQVNPYWTAQQNKQAWKMLKRTYEGMQFEDEDEADLQAMVRLLYKTYEVRQHRKADRRLLKRANLKEPEWLKDQIQWETDDEETDS